MTGLRELAGKSAVVTGGASGIGKAIAGRLIAEGMKVVIADIEREPLERAAAELGALAVCADVTSPQSMLDLAHQADRHLGGVDMFCSNAGVASTARIEAMTRADWEWLMDVNFYGVVNGIRAFLPLLRARPEGAHFTLTSSMSAFHVTPDIGAYTVSKFASAALVETLAAELAEDGANVGITLLCPGPVSSNLGSSQRNRPDSIGGAMVDQDLEHEEYGKDLRWLDPAKAADLLLRAIRKGELYAFTHPEWEGIVEQRQARIARAFAEIPGD